MAVLKFLGFLCGFALLAAVLYSVVTGSVFGNLALLGALFAVNLTISLLLPRISKQKLFSELKEGLEAFGAALNRVLVGGVLVIVYFTGVAVVWLLSRIVGKRFMDMNPGTTSWKTPEEENVEEMF